MEKICLQENKGDCGYASLKNLLIHYHKNNDFALLTDGYKENMSFKEIKDLGEKYNLDLQGVEFEEKEKLFDNTYSICQMKINETMHFVVFCFEKKGKITLLDPKYGKTVIPKDVFLSYFTGYTLIYVDHQLSDFKKKYQFSNIGHVLLYISSLIVDYGLVYLLSFLMKSDNYLSLLLITILGLTISIIAKTLIIKATYNEIDNKVINLLANNKNPTKEEMENLLLSKQVFVKRIYNTINSIALCLFSVILLVSNEVLNIVFILAIVVALILPHLIKKKTKVDEKYMLYLEEGKMYKNEDLKSTYRSLNKKINNLITKSMIMTIILYIFSITFSFLINYFNDYKSLTYIMFTSGLFILFIERMKMLINDYTNNKNEYNKMKSIFNRFSV